MKSGCEGSPEKAKRVVELPVLAVAPTDTTGIRKSKTSRWRAGALITLTLLMVAHLIQWRLMGTTVSPIEPSESMFTLQQGAVNAGFIFFSLAILSTLIFGRYVCGWGCHIVALQDFCAWLLKKVGLNPRPFRSRLLIYVPLVVAFYMFVWPTLARAFTKPPNEPLIPEFTNHLITSDFWATFPPVWVAIPFLFICGFVTVYFLGSKGFCTYACPYGGVFVLADKVAPGKIRVTDACNQCGHCTATCMANVQVHAEVAKYGMVVDPGCMKHMDCISVCPNDALYFGFGKPSVAAKPLPGAAAGAAPTYSLTWPEELLAAVVFFASFMAVWDVYQLVPMLMALGIASVTTYLAMRTLRLFQVSDMAFYRYTLRRAGKMRLAGWVFFTFSILWLALNVHSGWIRYHESRGRAAFERLRIADELALAEALPGKWLSDADKANVADGLRHFYIAFGRGLFTNAEALSKLAWLEYLAGDNDRALATLGRAVENQTGQERVLSLYYRGAILNRLGRNNEALSSLDAALAASPDLILAREERGEALWRLGRRDEAVETWRDAVGRNPKLVLANYQLAGALAAMGDAQAAAPYKAAADSATPNDPFYHWVLGTRLRRIGMNELADAHFDEAVRLDPKFRQLRPVR
jgi:tetratricopeptide (TPR) repeat protein/polyferredoxin